MWRLLTQLHCCGPRAQLCLQAYQRGLRSDNCESRAKLQWKHKASQRYICLSAEEIAPDVHLDSFDQAKGVPLLQPDDFTIKPSACAGRVLRKQKQRAQMLLYAQHLLRCALPFDVLGADRALVMKVWRRQIAHIAPARDQTHRHSDQTHFQWIT